MGWGDVIHRGWGMLSVGEDHWNVLRVGSASLLQTE